MQDLIERLEKAKGPDRGRACLVHYSSNPLRRIHSRQQQASPNSKPDGLWVSVEGEEDWPWWCEAESWGIGPVETEISLRDNANILWLRTVDDVDEFDRVYGVCPYGTPTRAIDWRAVADKYGGVIIAPYQWDRRFTFSWYYGWDCASGCIWDASCIAALRARGEG